MDPLAQTAEEFGVSAAPRYLGGGRRPFQSLQSAYESQAVLLNATRQGMAVESEALALAGQRDRDAAFREDRAFELRERERAVAVRDKAFSVLNAFGPRVLDDPNVYSEVQQIVVANPELLGVPEFQVAYGTITERFANMAEVQDKARAERQKAQRSYLESEDRRIAADIKAVQEDVELDAVARAERLQALRQQQEANRQLRIRVIDGPLDAVTEGPQASTTFQQAYSLVR